MAPVTQAMSGVMSINGEPDGPPTKSGLSIVDLSGGYGAAIALLGLAILAGKLDLPHIADYVLLVVGMFDIMVMPLVLAKRWRTPR